jgi:hypothetical protein
MKFVTNGPRFTRKRFGRIQKMERAECGVVKLISNYKSQACLSISKEILKSWLHSLNEEVGLHSSQISISIDVQATENQKIIIAMEILAEHDIYILPTASQSTNKADADSNQSIFEIIQIFNNILDCCCTAAFESSESHGSSSKWVRLEIQGISETLLETGE